MAALSHMTLEVSHLNNQVGLQNIAIAKGRSDGDLVVLTVCTLTALKVVFELLTVHIVEDRKVELESLWPSRHSPALLFPNRPDHGLRPSQPVRLHPKSFYYSYESQSIFLLVKQ